MGAAALHYWREKRQTRGEQKPPPAPLRCRRSVERPGPTLSQTQSQSLSRKPRRQRKVLTRSTKNGWQMEEKSFWLRRSKTRRKEKGRLLPGSRSKSQPRRRRRTRLMRRKRRPRRRQRTVTTSRSFLVK